MIRRLRDGGGTQAPATSGAHAAAPRGTLPTPAERRGTMQLPDGRTLVWHEWGPPGGRPVVYCPGAATSGALGFGATALPALGLRLLAVDRPGLGASDPHPAKTLDTWADDVRHLLAAAAPAPAGAATAVGFSQGGPFALALAGRGVVGAAALVSAQDDLAHPALRARLPDAVADMVAAARRDPGAFAQEIARVATADWLWDLVLATSAPEDRAIYAGPGFAPAFRRALDEGFAQGPAGYARDLALTYGPWPVPPEEVRAPIDLWYGALDASPVHSPDHGARLAARLPHAARVVDPGAGGALLWTRAADVLAALARHLA